MKARRTKSTGSLLALELRRHLLVAVEMSPEGAELRRAESAMAVDLLGGAPDLVGTQIADALGAAGIRTRRCVVSIPAEWTVVHTVEVPPMAEADLPAFLELEVERLMPFGATDMVAGWSLFPDADGGRHATLVAISASTVASLTTALQTARLRVEALTVGAAALATQQPEPVSGVLLAADRSADLAVALDGRPAVLRTLAAGDDSEATLQDLVREVRLTHRRVAAWRPGQWRTLQVFGAPARRQALVALLRTALPGINVVEATGDAASGAMAAAKVLQAGDALTLQFHRPKPAGLAGLLTRLRGRTLAVRVAALAALLAVIVAGVFAWRQTRLSALEREWATMEPQVARLAAIQEDIRQWRPWFDEVPHSLEMMAGLTAAFPERGDTWARVVQMREQNLVSCSGLGKSNDACLALFNALRRTPGVEDVRLAQLRGEDPVQFTMTFRWRTGGSR